MTARPAVALDLDDAAFIAAALRLLLDVLARQGRRPVGRVAELEQQLTAASRPDPVDRTSKHADTVAPPESDVTDDGLTTEQAAARLVISPEAVRRHCRTGRLTARRHAGHWIITPASVDALRQQRKDRRSCRI